MSLKSKFAILLGLLGLVLAWLYHRSGSLVPGMVAHGFNNGLAFGLLYLFGM